MRWLPRLRWQSLLAAALFEICNCAKIPNSIVLIVPVNDSIILNKGNSPVLVTYGLNESVIPFEIGYSRNTSFSLTYPNGTVLSDNGGVLDVCRSWPGATYEIFQIADSAGVYTLTVNVTYALPESGASCTTGPYSYQSEIISAAFNVLPAQSNGSNGTQTIITKTFASQPTGSVQLGSATKSVFSSLISFVSILQLFAVL